MADEKTYYFPPAHIKWDAIAGTKYGDLPELDITVPATLSARIDIWKVPVCEAYPEGYFVGCTSSGSWYNAVEPGCCDWEKHCLAKIRFTGVDAEIGPKPDTQSSANEGRKATVEFCDPAIRAHLDEAALQPEEVEQE